MTPKKKIFQRTKELNEKAWESYNENPNIDSSNEYEYKEGFVKGYLEALSDQFQPKEEESKVEDTEPSIIHDPDTMWPMEVINGWEADSPISYINDVHPIMESTEEEAELNKAIEDFNSREINQGIVFPDDYEIRKESASRVQCEVISPKWAMHMKGFREGANWAISEIQKQLNNK